MIKIHILLLASAILVSCGSSIEKRKDKVTSRETIRVQERAFGTMPGGEAVFEYTLSNTNGMKVSIITYGSIIRSLLVPDKNGKLSDVVLGYDHLQGYLDSNPYFGAMVGRYGNRIAKGQFSLDGTDYQLATNNLGNHLHGGEVGFDKVLWVAKVIQGEGGPVLQMTYLSKDGEEGYPGNLEVTVDYRLNHENELVIDYSATTDKKTIVNLTSHSYFNLSGSADILSHQFQINAENYLHVDETLIPTKITPVASTPFDFRKLKAIGTDIHQEDDQLKNGAGYDHCWALDGSNASINLAATLYDALSGRKMDIYTTEPGIQFYSGNFLDGSITGKGNKVYTRRSGLCLETQHFPDSPNRPDFPSTVLNPGEVYRSKTVHKFSVE